MGLQRERPPDAADRALAHPAPPCHQTRAPVRGLAWRRFQSQREHSLHVGIADFPWGTGATFLARRPAPGAPVAQEPARISVCAPTVPRFAAPRSSKPTPVSAVPCASASPFYVRCAP